MVDISAGVDMGVQDVHFEFNDAIPHMMVNPILPADCPEWALRLHNCEVIVFVFCLKKCSLIITLIL